MKKKSFISPKGKLTFYRLPFNLILLVNTCSPLMSKVFKAKNANDLIVDMALDGYWFISEVKAFCA